MKKVLLSALALAAAATALPAAAGSLDVAAKLGTRVQYNPHYSQDYRPGYDPRHGYDRGYGHDRDWSPIARRLERLDQRIERGIERGQITRREAAGLRAEFHQLVRLEHRYSRNGLSWQERADLDARFDHLAQRVRWERRDGDRYGYRY